MTRALIVATALLVAPVLAAAQHPHSKAPQAKFGSVHFPTSCKRSVAPRFDLAVAMLHSFEFGQSIRTFEEVLAADSTCAMAYWGIALSRWSNPMAAGNRAPAVLALGKKASDAALALAARATPRERDYIQAVSELYADFANRDQPSRVLAYERAMADVARRHPADMEAKIFHAIALVASASPADKSYSKQLEAGRQLEALFEKQPDHPGLAHYIIHTYDYPPLAEKARAAAQRYAGIAPSAAHALHMPSHTFTRAGMWDESVSSNDRSMSVALSNNSIAEALHAADYAVYAHLQMGREREAKAIIDQLPALAARFDPNAITGAAPGSAGLFALAAIPARWTLERQAWAEAAALEPRATAFPYTEAMTYFARALGAARIGKVAAAKSAADSLGAIHHRLTARNETYWAEQVGIQHLAALAWIDLAEKRETQALERMREAARREDATEKSAVSPGPLAPARELLGDMLVQLKRPAEAAVEYRQVLVKEPNRRHAMNSLERLKSET